MATADRRVAILGLGLIGGSLLRCLAAGGATVIGYDADPASIEAARAAGCDATGDPAELRAPDVVVIATPLPAVAAMLDLTAAIQPAPIVTDVVSVKAPVARLASDRAPRLRYVGGHPMAGTEHSGFAAAQPGLFAGAPWVLCLDEDTEIDAWLTVAAMATAADARVVPATSDRHDAAVATISHVPHLLAAALSTSAAADPLALALAAGSFRDATRVMQTRPDLVAAMCAGNTAAVRAALGDVVRRLDELDASLPNAARLEATFARAHAVRTAWPASERTASSHLEVTGPTLRSDLIALGESGGWVESVDSVSLTVVSTA